MNKNLIITFPKREWASIKKDLDDGKVVSTTRLHKDYNKFKVGKIYQTEWGDLIKIISSKKFTDPKKIPTYLLMDEIMKKSIKEGIKYGGNKIDWLHFRKINKFIQ